MQPGLLLAVVLAAAPSGRAPLRLQFEQCPDIDQTTVRRVVTMELEAALADERPGGALTTATAACTGTTVRLTIDDPVTEKSTARTIDLDGQPRSLHSRLVGLAISEAVLASWIELRLAPDRPSTAPSETAWPETRRAAAAIAFRRLRDTAPPSPPVRPQLMAGPALRWFSSGLLTLGLGASTRHWLDADARAGVEIALDVGHGQRSVTDVAQASATTLSLAPSIVMRGDFAPVVVTAGAGWRVGLARLAADPHSPLRTGRGAVRPWTGPLLAVALSLPLGRSFLLCAGVETGYVLAPARGGIAGVEVIALAGSWLAGTLSLGATL